MSETQNKPLTEEDVRRIVREMLVEQVEPIRQIIVTTVRDAQRRGALS